MQPEEKDCELPNKFPHHKSKRMHFEAFENYRVTGLTYFI